MELNVGNYVRTTNGISKIVAFYSNAIFNDKNKRIENNSIIKSSPNIIDLIEVYDVLKLFDEEYGLTYKAEVVLDEEGHKYIGNYEHSDLLNLEWELISNEHVTLLSIVTKEQFSAMEYKL